MKSNSVCPNPEPLRPTQTGPCRRETGRDSERKRETDRERRGTEKGRKEEIKERKRTDEEEDGAHIAADQPCDVTIFSVNPDCVVVGLDILIFRK